MKKLAFLLCVIATAAFAAPKVIPIVPPVPNPIKVYRDRLNQTKTTALLAAMEIQMEGNEAGIPKKIIIEIRPNGSSDVTVYDR
jgi:hypothetical protein